MFLVLAKSSTIFSTVAQAPRPRIHDLEMPRAWNHHQPYIFFSIRLGAHIVLAETWRHDIIPDTLDYALWRADRQLHRVGLAIVIRNLCGRSTEKFHHGIVAQMQFVRALQIDYSGQRNRARQPDLMRRQTQRQLRSRRMSQHDYMLRIEMILLRFLH